MAVEWGQIASIGQSAADFGGGLANTLTDKYGYSTQGARYKYGQKGTSRTKAGLISGAYTDLSKELETPEERVKNKKFNALNSAGLVFSSTGLSSGELSQAMGQPSAKPTQNTANQLGMFDTGGNMKPMLNPELGNQMGTKDFSTPLDNPSLISGLKPNVPSNATFSMNEGTPDDLTPSGGGLSLQGGGKNKGGAVPVEAEGGEWEVSFDKAYTVKNITPVVGAKHEQGGVDLKLPKNHAILNKEQYTRLQQGESLKAILDSVPSVKEVGKADMGVDNPPDEQVPGFKWPLYNRSNIYSTSFPIPEEPKPKPIEIPQAPDAQPNVQYLPYPTTDEQDQNLISGLRPNTPKSASFEETGKKPQSPALGDVIPTKEPYSYTQSPEETAQWDNILSTPYKPKDKEPPNRFQFGYPEKATLANALQNLVAILQPRAKGVTVGSPPSQTPAMVSSHPQNPKATLDEIGKQFKAGLAQLQQTGQTHLIPSLIRSSMDATSKVGEQYAQENLGAEAQSQAENAKASNEMSMQRTGIDADTIWKNAQLELQKLQMQGAQDSERFRSIQNLIGGVATYDRLKQEEQMRDMVYYQMWLSQHPT